MFPNEENWLEFRDSAKPSPCLGEEQRIARAKASQCLFEEQRRGAIA